MRKIANPPQPSELLIDLLLMLFERARASGELADAVGELRGRDVPLATFYRQLQRAVDFGWVNREAEAEHTTSGRSGPGRPQHLYRITDLGSAALRGGMEQQQRRVSRAQALGLLTELAR